MAFKVSTQGNGKLKALLARVNADEELLQLWECANISATERAGISDHGPVHIQIVANACVKLLRLLRDAEVVPSIVKDYGMAYEDAEVVVVLAACLHDIGIAVHRDNHEAYSLNLAYPKARQLLADLYPERERTKIVVEVLHAIIAHRWDVTCFTLEAGALKVADALDMTEGRSRIPFEAGEINIHSVSAQAIESVSIVRGEERPIRLDIKLNNSAGIFQVDELLRRKLTNSTLRPYVEVSAHLEGESERRLLQIYRL
jgi:metal-dependent HD superfamily phosphatase/phosphodiesterase